MRVIQGRKFAREPSANMEISDYLVMQKQDFIRAFLSALYPVGLRSPLQLDRFPGPQSYWRWDDALGTQRAFIRVVEDQYKEYWVDVHESRYRNAFTQFLQSVYEIDPASIPSDLHVDHMLNKSFAHCHGLRFVRVAFVPQVYNVGWGGRVEKLLTRAIAIDKPMYLFDYFIFMKVMNMLPPVDEADYRARRLGLGQRISAETGLSLEITLQGMDGIFKLWPVL